MNRTADEKTSTRKLLDPKVVFTIWFVLSLLLLVVLRTNGWRLPLPRWMARNMASAPAGPEDAVYAMLDAARAGDTKAYLDAFSGAMRDQLVEVMKENAEPSFAAYLKSQNAAFQGVAVSVTDRPVAYTAFAILAPAGRKLVVPRLDINRLKLLDRLGAAHVRPFQQPSS